MTLMRFLTVLPVVAGVLAGVGPASASAADRAVWTAVEPSSPGTGYSELTGVAVLSARDTWAVGDDAGETGGGRTLIEHWNGSTWSAVPSPDPGPSGDFLGAVGAVSADNVWAVGEHDNGEQVKTLILHWNGTAWKQVVSPSPGRDDDQLNAVRVVSASDIWAVGEYQGYGIHEKTLILHWDGTQWTQVPSPDPGVINHLYGVAATSSSDAWAVGSFGSQQTSRPLILHWNGVGWTRVSTSALKSGGALSGIDATSAANAWAVGYSSSKFGQRTLTMHWNGTAWTPVASPDPRGDGSVDSLQAVTVTPDGDAWAVGDVFFHDAFYRSLILHWNGAAWARVAAPNPGTGGALSSVAVSSYGDAWAVGDYGVADGSGDAFAVHCPACG